MPVSLWNERCTCLTNIFVVDEWNDAHDCLDKSKDNNTFLCQYIEVKVVVIFDTDAIV